MVEETVEVEGKVVMFKYGCPVLDIHYSGQGTPQHYLNFKKHKIPLKDIQGGDWIKVKAEKVEDRKTLNVTKVLGHNKVEQLNKVTLGEKEKVGERIEKIEKPTEGAIIFKEETVPTVLAKKAEIEPFVHMLVSVEKIVDTFKKFKEVKAKILEEDDFLYVDKSGVWHNNKPSSGVVNEYIKKTGWQKLSLAFSLDIERLSKMKHIGKDKHGEYYVWTYCYRIAHPSGKFVITEGSCSSRDSFFGKKHGEIVEPLESDIMNTAQTVCINRGISILLGGGVSAEEMMKQRE